MTSISIHQLLPAALLAATIGSGCVAFNVGKPETFTHTDRIVETAAEPSRIEMLSAGARFLDHGKEAVVSLGLELTETFEKMERSETVTVRKQKRLAVGLFPGAAEFMSIPDNSLRPVIFEDSIGWSGDPPHGSYTADPKNNSGRFIFEHLACALLVGLVHIPATVNSLLIAPFASSPCDDHNYMDSNSIQFRKNAGSYGGFWDDSKSPKLQAILRFPASARERMAVHTCFDSLVGKSRTTSFGTRNIRLLLSHLGLIGFHKYFAIFVDGPTAGPTTVIGTETKRRSALARGPFVTELQIPAMNLTDWKRIAPGETQAVFSLPAVERDCTVEAVVSFREDPSANGLVADELTRQALAKAAGREWRFDLALKGTGLPASGPTLVRAPAPQPAAPLFEVVEITPKGDGQYFVRVAIKDKSKTFSVRNLVKPEVSRLVREDFRSKHPGEPARFVRENMRYETENDGDYLACAGWVFSVRPTEDGWNYDAASRTGWIRLRVTGGIPASEAEAWAHENIAEIVKYKNAVLEPGKAPPPGAAFRSLGEKFEEGVLTVEFEAVQ